MDTCVYEKVETAVEPRDNNDSWKYFFRQLFMCSTLWVIYFLLGVCLGAPTVYIPQMRREANSTEVITDSMAAMLGAIYGYSALPWVIILPAVTTVFGRKKPSMFVFGVVFIAEITFYTSTSYTQLLISQALEGIMPAFLMTISCMILTENTTPKYRGFILTFKSATCFWGIWVSNTIGTFFHWKVISVLKVVLCIYPLVTVFFWPESPLWLAKKGRREECIRFHRWLKGTGKESEQDLQRLLSNDNIEPDSKMYLKIITQKQFYKPTLLCIFLSSLYYFSGKLTIAYYALDILKMMTSSTKAAQNGMLILDGVTVLGMYIGAVVSRFVKRRTIFLASTCLGIAALYALGTHVYLVSVSILPENKYTSIGLLSIYSLGIGCGPMILCSSFYAELLPLNHRSFSIMIMSFLDRTMYSLVSHLTPIVTKALGLHSTFLIYAVSCTVLIVILYVYLPETKDKSLHEIADAFGGDKKEAMTRPVMLKTTDLQNEHLTSSKRYE